MNDKHSSQREKRSRFVHPVTLLIIAAVLVIALLLLFPARRYMTLGQAEQVAGEASSVSISYLKALLRANPDDIALRLNLAREQAEAGQIYEARQTIDPLIRNDYREARWLAVDLAWQAYNAAPADAPNRERLRDDLIARMQAAQQADDLSAEQLETLAEHWLQLERPIQAAELYERLASVDEAQAYDWYAKAARWWLAADRSYRSAEAWRLAFRATDDPDRRREAALAALDAARQANDQSSVAFAGEFIEAYPQDPTFLDIGIEAALESNRLVQAREWSQRYLELRPNDDAALERDTQIALSLNQLDEALAGLQRLVDRNPDSERLRARLAQVQIWADRPRQALNNYRYLAGRYTNSEYDQAIIRLSQQLNEHEALLEALQREQARGRLTAQQEELVISVLDATGRPEQAINILERRTREGRAQRAEYVVLAALQEDTGNLDAALATWNALVERWGRSLDETQARGRMRVKQWQLEEAYSILDSLDNPPPADSEQAIFYWTTLGELAWNLNRLETVRRAYYELYKAGELDEGSYIRLVYAADQTDRVEMAMRVTRTGWREYRYPQPVLEMLGVAERRGRSDLTEELFAMTAEQPELFEPLPGYWQLYGQYLFNQGELEAARRAYLRALALAPGDIDARAALLYTLAEMDRHDELSRYVEAWADDAVNDPRQWQAFGMAYDELGQTRRALPWFDRAMQANPDNYILALEYADALERARRFDSARRMRQYAVTELRPRLMRELQEQGRLTRTQQAENARILSVQSEMLGAPGNRAWLARALGDRSGDRLTPVDVEMLFSYYLAQDEPGYTRYWLLEAQRRRVRMEKWQELAVAMQTNDQDAMQDILARAETEGVGGIGVTDRVSTLRQLDYRGRALTLALDHQRPSEPYVAGLDTLPRYAAELYREMPQTFGSELVFRSISDLSIGTQRAFLKLSSERLTTGIEIGNRELSEDGLGVDLNGLDDETFASMTLNWRERRGETTVRVGTVQTEAADTFQLGVAQDWLFTDAFIGTAFWDYNVLPDETGQLRVLGLREDFGVTLGYALTSRDSLSLTTSYSQFETREQGNDLATGYNVDVSYTHALLTGATRQVLLRTFANTSQNSLEDELPADAAARLAPGTNIDDVVPERFTYIGAGVTFSRGLPGSDYPVVASPRYILSLDTGYVMPDNDIGFSARLGVGTRLLGSDELSFNIGVDQTGSQTQQNSYTGSIKYQYFLGR